MKRTSVFFRVMPIAIAGLIASGCGPIRQMSQTQSMSPFGQNIADAPCVEKDTHEYFVGIGIETCTKYTMNEGAQKALMAAQTQVASKMKSRIKAATTQYLNSYGNNQGADAQNKMENMGEKVINAIMNDTYAECGPRYSNMDDKGNVQCYIGVRIYKKRIVDAMVNQVSNDEKMKIDFKEKQFREQMEKAFNEYKDEQ